MNSDLSVSASDGRLIKLDPPVSWSAVVAGAVVALAASILLTLVGAGLGLRLGFGGLASRSDLLFFTPALGAEAIVIQVLSAALGGYLAGRLRHAWMGVHTDETHFRDTAHGLIAWALSAVLGVVLAATVLAPCADALAGPPGGLVTLGQDERAADVAAQAALFAGLGMLLSAFVAAIAARLGGLRTEEMHPKP